MARKFVLKVAIASLVGVALLVLSLPIGLYWLGLSKVEGRPEPPTQTNNIAADTALLLQNFRSQAPIAVHALNPWTYAARLLNEPANDLRMDPGSHAILVDCVQLQLQAPKRPQDVLLASLWCRSLDMAVTELDNR